jgi:hypothetical protein
MAPAVAEQHAAYIEKQDLYRCSFQFIKLLLFGPLWLSAIFQTAH